MKKIKTFERTTTSRLDYKFDLAPKTNGREDGDSDYLQDGEIIIEYSVVSSDPDFVIDDSYLRDDSTSIVIWVSGGVLADSVYYVDLHIKTSLGREDDFSLRFILVERK